ncbi:hypothetical protein [Nocardia sp. NPDC050793]|uniref:hypothetical protein n=1 Tax=Nocardia sp. NPDC050793 TaxID=3155159 RepID=UPI0034056A2B
MEHIVRKIAGLAAAVAVAPVMLAATAQAESGPVFFSAGSTNCAIYDNGTVGCDLGSPTRLQYSSLPFLLTVNEIVIDQPWLPAHPTFDPGTPYTLPGGNPPLSEVKTGDGQWGSYIEYAGARCSVGFHGSFGCQSKGRSFTSWSGTISA